MVVPGPIKIPGKMGIVALPNGKLLIATDRRAQISLSKDRYLIGRARSLIFRLKNIHGLGLLRGCSNDYARTFFQCVDRIDGQFIEMLDQAAGPT